MAARRASGSRPGERTDGNRLAMVIEGGGMRAAITGGMAIALEDAGFTDAFDDVYGSSAGTLNGAWFVAGAARTGLPSWSDPVFRMATVRRSNLLRGKPLVDSHYLTEVVYEKLTPMPFERVVGSPVRLHPIATNATTGRSEDLGPYVTDTPSLKLALRATTGLPLLSGRPIEIGGKRWFDAGLAESVPYRTAIAQGATHVLVLRSRRRDEQQSREGGRTAAIVARYLSRHSPELADAFLQRPARLVSDDSELDALEEDISGGHAILSVRPPAGTPDIGRLERDHSLILAGLEAGRMAVRPLTGT